MPRAIIADFNATTPLGAAAVQRMSRAFECWGNPSSAHRLGREARQLLDEARGAVAGACGVPADEVVFTSGGSEASSMALLGSWFQSPQMRLVTSRVEHSSVRDTAKFLESKGVEVAYVRVRPGSGELDRDHLGQLLREFRPTLVSLMAANNETGVLFPIPDIARQCAEAGVAFHTDAVQAMGKLPAEHWNGADFVSVSAHKIHGPKGCGALLVRNGRKLLPTHFGGSQETKRRGGTENLVGISGFGGAASELAPREVWSRIEQLRDSFEARLEATLEDVTVNGKGAARLPNTSNVRFPGIPSEVLLGSLDLDGIAVSAGSACSSGSITPSHVLTEIGLDAVAARECLRFSWGQPTTEQDVQETAERVIHHVNRIRARRARGGTA